MFSTSLFYIRKHLIYITFTLNTRYQKRMSNLKLGRPGNTKSLILSRRVSSWKQLERSLLGTRCKYVKCFISIMKSPSTSKGGTDGSDHRLKVNRRKCRHLLRIGKTSSIEGPLPQLRWTSVVCWAGSNSAKPSKSTLETSNRSISTWRQFLTIYEQVSSVVKFQKATNVITERGYTSFK